MVPSLVTEDQWQVAAACVLALGRLSKEDRRAVLAYLIKVAVESPELIDEPVGVNEAAVTLGKRGGAKGGPARAKKLTASERAAIASRASKARWAK